MASYNFRRESKVYVVRNNVKYQLDVYPDLSFSQTFNETNVPVKTLHAQYNMFEAAVISSANPANFNLTLPILYEGDMGIILQLLRDYDTTSSEATLNTADIYVETQSDTFKLDKCVLENGVFQLARESIIVLSLSGTAKKLSKFTGTIPGVPSTRGTSTYGMTRVLDIKLGGVTLTNVAGLSIELTNNVSWVQHETIHNSQNIENASGTMYPEVFVVGGRTFSGNIQVYQTDENSADLNTWDIGRSLVIKVGNSTYNWLLEFNMPSIVFTNRLSVEEIYMQSYDFRMDQSPSNISNIIKHLPN